MKAKDVYWFPHDANARNDPKVSRLLMLGGQAAKGSYWDMVEILREAADYRIALEELPAIEYACRFPAGAVDQMLEAGLLEQDDTHLWSESLNRRMEHMDDIRGKRKTAGSLGGKAKAAARVKQEPSNGVASAKQVLGNEVASAKQKSSKLYLSDQIREYQNIEEKKGAAGDHIDKNFKTESDRECFGAFWKLYPRRKAKLDAQKAWKQTAKARPTIGVILGAIGRQLRDPQWQKGIIPLPASWLRGERWNDEPERGGPMVGRPQPKEQVEVDDGPAATDEEKAAAFKQIRGKLGMNPFTAEGEG